jgi:hypothetical protein
MTLSWLPYGMSRILRTCGVKARLTPVVRATAMAMRMTR